ncbi:deoxyribodipyrimidine photo-lyase [Algibacillus agarilyticus]|uniref:deoxyribodipyrimidine photo-lyase n=1 Tax=Algibacillus agarilyticus TaxID=2234133 RepID=UPI000DCFD9B1|nr:deoxyribodipyrimidine photo-lyase [Algibacillus agarilyticus]
MHLMWFRNDLRTHDNPALSAANHAKSINSQNLTSEKQPVNCRAIYFITPKQWQQHDLAPIKIDFILRHLALLKYELQQLGIDLTVIEVADYSAQVAALIQYCRDHQISAVFANSEPEINEVLRDKKLIDSQLNLNLYESDVIIPKGVVLNKQGEMFKVFTPFKNAWLKHILNNNFDCQDNVQAIDEDTLKTIEHTTNHFVTTAPRQDSSQWPLANKMINHVLPHFYNNKIAEYANTRDIPSIKGTSGLSPYLAIGAISSRLVLLKLLQHEPLLLTQNSHPSFSWLNELIWREFYRNLLFHFPMLCKRQNFKQKFQHLPWPNNPDLFEAWKTAKTGFPIVDAAMRQLNQTGWMHNRLRMIVASFLTKHLLIDWRIGERYFMQHLIDGDLAANNGGWQWSAGTGCDAQPYFRIFNPITQSKNFDPNGTFIRKYLPELQDIPDKYIHEPHAYLDRMNKTADYWPAIVDLKQARAQALSFYKL